MCVPLTFSLLNRFTHNLLLEAPLIYIPSLAFVGVMALAPYLIVAGRARGIRTLTGGILSPLSAAVGLPPHIASY